MVFHHSLSHLSSFLLLIDHSLILPVVNLPPGVCQDVVTAFILFVYLWPLYSLCVCLRGCFSWCPQDKLFTLEEDSIMSGRGRCPYDPSSPCTSTLSSKTLLNVSLSSSHHQLWRSNVVKIYRAIPQWSGLLTCWSLISQYCHLVVLSHQCYNHIK